MNIDQFFRGWTYSVSREFTIPAGQPFPYAPNGKQAWGDEVKKLTFATDPVANPEPDMPEAHAASTSCDGKSLAVAVKNEVYIYGTDTWECVNILSGHTERIAGVQFNPSDPSVLISSEMGNYMASNGEPLIVVWDIARESPNAVIQPESNDREGDEKILAPIDRPTSNNEPANIRARVSGRLVSGFEYNVFSPSGKWMAYMPGREPDSKYGAHPPGKPPKIESWDVAICSTLAYDSPTILHGHTDIIQWIGWSPDESLIGTVSWDGTIRIWDAITGQEKLMFATDTQNWTGGFSPDSSHFAATSGDGTLHIYSLEDGSTHWELKEKKHNWAWKRALAWHPNGEWLALGSQYGVLQLLDVKNKQILQERVLKAPARVVDDDREEMDDAFTVFNEVTHIEFLAGGDKLAFWTYGDGSADIIDLKEQAKWRFARGGTDDGSGADDWRDEDGFVMTRSGLGAVFWEDTSKDQVMLASIDNDGVRIWSTLKAPKVLT
jgi:WD40 repeat protein